MGTRNLAEASLEELYDMGTELRKELADLPEGDSRDSDRVRALCDEANELDTRITLIELEERRAKASLASTAGGTRSDLDTRSLGEFVVTEDLVRWAAKTTGNRYGRESGDTWEMSIEDMGSAAQMFVRSIAEWDGSSGPPTYDTSGAGNLLPVGQPIAPIPRQARCTCVTSSR